MYCLPNKNMHISKIVYFEKLNSTSEVKEFIIIIQE